MHEELFPEKKGIFPLTFGACEEDDSAAFSYRVKDIF